MSSPGKRRQRPVEEPLGAILAGGLARRIGGNKPALELRRRPLIRYPLDAVAAVLKDVAVVAKAETNLPHLAGVPVLVEPPTPHHPLVGIIHALSAAEGRPVLVCAADLPFVSPGLVTCLIESDPRGAAAVIATCRGATQPLLGCYQPSALEPLARALRAGQPRLQEVAAAIDAGRLEVQDPGLLFNVNTPQDLEEADAMLAQRSTGQ